MTHILLYSDNTLALDPIADVTWHPTSSLLALPAVKAHGIASDVRRLVKAAPEEKLYLATIERFLPHLRLPGGNPRGGLCSGHGMMNLPDFVALCSRREPRYLRSSERVNVHVPVRLYREGSAGSFEQSMTINLSMGGCFVYCVQPPPSGRVVLTFEFPESDIRIGPVLGEIAWVMPWGRACSPPGIGVRFVDFPATQAAHLMNLAKDAARRAA